MTWCNVSKWQERGEVHGANICRAIGNAACLVDLARQDRRNCRRMAEVVTCSHRFCCEARGRVAEGRPGLETGGETPATDRTETSRELTTELGEMSSRELAEKKNSEVAESRVTLREKSGETAPEESREIVGGKSRVTTSETADDGDEFTKIWPIGTPWEHLETEDADDSEPFEVRTRSVLLQMNTVLPSFHSSSNLRLPLPRTEEEMRALLKKFTHEATVYRSYYKHWKDTAEQAIKEIGGRPVLATFLVQGLDKHGTVKEQPAVKPAVTISKSRVRGKRRGKASAKSSAKPSDEKLTQSAILENDTAVTAVDEVDEERDKPEEKEEEKEEEEQANPKPSEEPSKFSPVSSRATRGTALRMSERTADESKGIASSITSYLVATVEADDLTKDHARSLEPVPYIFYLRAEPDIEIATEHDDEQVVAADPDRENVTASYKQLFFNLTDKPCKGGKPWIL
ncbi:unnamed protein product [Heterotrigona itama]|uniref:Uncharacterized protein n=1 Tax=Heterotrigona itama TaxID=395501 RepID=A0A6V7H5K4_9HYME|nr:unnamed protein product [Heterotrigona itama]